MNTPLLILLLAAVSALASPGGLAAGPAFATPSAARLAADDEAAARRDDLYRSAREDLDAGRWKQAVDKFGQVAQKRGPAADGALYWKAYAQRKAGQPQQALATLRQLTGTYPKSPWVDDAKALQVEIGGADTGADTLPSEDEELQLYALNGLMAASPDRALPVLQKFLDGKHSVRLKEQALFIVSQSGAPAAHAILLASARGTSHPELQLKAIEYLGIAGGEPQVQALDEILRAASRPEVRQAVLNAYLVAHQPARVLAVARDAKDPLQNQAINLLGAMQAREELKQLYQGAGSGELRQTILNALGIAGAVDTLVDIAKRETNPELRAAAIRGLGIGGGPKGAEALRAMYAGTSDAGVRRAVIEALFLQNNARALIETFRAEKDRDLRREIVQRLSQMRSEEATQFLEKIYSN